MADERAVRENDLPPGIRARWVAALPLYFFYVVYFAVLIASKPFKRMYDEMDIGDLPVPSQVLLSFCAISIHYYYFLPPLMFLGAWGFFSWACRERRRMLLTAKTIACAGFLFLSYAVVALLLPLGTIGGMGRSTVWRWW